MVFYFVLKFPSIFIFQLSVNASHFLQLWHSFVNMLINPFLFSNCMLYVVYNINNLLTLRGSGQNHLEEQFTFFQWRNEIKNQMRWNIASVTRKHMFVSGLVFQRFHVCLLIWLHWSFHNAKFSRMHQGVAGPASSFSRLGSKCCVGS